MKFLLQARFAELTREASVTVMLNVECSIAEHQELHIEQSLEIRDTLFDGLRASQACRDPAQFRPRARASGHGTLHEACDVGRFHNELHESCGLIHLLFLCVWFNQRNGTYKTHQPISSCSRHNSPLPQPRRSSNEMPWGLALKFSMYSSEYASGICGLWHRIGPHLLHLVTNAISDRFSETWQSDPMLPKSQIREKLFWHKWLLTPFFHLSARFYSGIQAPVRPTR
jgi:hypothetical protein